VAHVLTCDPEKRIFKLTLRQGGFKEAVGYRFPPEELEAEGTIYEGTVKKLLQKTDR
jgi:hypothetical protein